MSNQIFSKPNLTKSDFTKHTVTSWRKATLMATTVFALSSFSSIAWADSINSLNLLNAENSMKSATAVTTNTNAATLAPTTTTVATPNTTATADAASTMPQLSAGIMLPFSVNTNPQTDMPPQGMMVDKNFTYTYKATKLISNTTTNLSGSIQNQKADQNVIQTKDSGKAIVTKATINKSGNTTNEDESNFRGRNAAILATPNSEMNITNSSITTESDGSNAVFASGTNAIIRISDSEIKTTQNSSRGLDATYNGTVIGNNMTITTKGAHSASLATDRGEGTIIVHTAKLQTEGQGSPLIYSTGQITLTNGTGESFGSEIGCIEGKNQITIKDSTLVGHVDNGFMLYQSFSGDAESGIARLVTDNSDFTTYATGAFIHVNNTKADVKLNNTTIHMPNTRTFLNASANRWGQAGENGGHITLEATNQHIDGNIVADSISTVALSLSSNSTLIGAINSENTAQSMDLVMSKDSTWTLTGNSYVTSLINEDTTNGNIITNGYGLYVNGVKVK